METEKKTELLTPSISCVILAGGLATRMRPITETIPKSLIPIHGIPFVKYQLQWLAKNGITDIIFSIGYKGKMIRDFVESDDSFGLQITYVDEGEHLRGTGGALRLCLEQNKLPEKFLILYGDSFLPISFTSVWNAFEKSKQPALMTVHKNAGKWDKSNICYRNGQIALYDKHKQTTPPFVMEYIDYGLLGLTRKVVEERIPALAPGKKHDLADTLCMLSKNGDLAGHEIKERFYEIGSTTGLTDFEAWVKSSWPEINGHPIS